MAASGTVVFEPGRSEIVVAPDAAGVTTNVFVKTEIPPGGRLLCELKVPNARPSPWGPTP